jgi:hypothetical protein
MNNYFVDFDNIYLFLLVMLVFIIVTLGATLAYARFSFRDLLTRQQLFNQRLENEDFKIPEADSQLVSQPSTEAADTGVRSRADAGRGSIGTEARPLVSTGTHALDKRIE